MQVGTHLPENLVNSLSSIPIILLLGASPQTPIIRDIKEDATMANRTRTLQIKFRVSEEERQMFVTKMKQYGTDNMEAYLRKMAIDGYVIKKDYSEIKKLTAELGKIGSNINQLAKRANQSRNVSADEIRNILVKQFEIERLVKATLSKLI